MSKMEHLVIYFKHEMRDIIPYHECIVKVRGELEENGLGQYLGDDMAIDGGDAEGVFLCNSAKILFEYLQSHLSSLTFLRGARITFVFGELDSNAPVQEFYL